MGGKKQNSVTPIQCLFTYILICLLPSYPTNMVWYPCQCLKLVATNAYQYSQQTTCHPSLNSIRCQIKIRVLLKCHEAILQNACLRLDGSILIRQASNLFSSSRSLNRPRKMSSGSTCEVVSTNNQKPTPLLLKSC